MMPSSLWYRTLMAFFAAVGMLTLALLVLGLTLDIRAIDETRGGHEPPYTNYTGTPIDWEQLDTTHSGMVYRGRIIDILIDCRTGMAEFDLFNFRIPWRELSPRAIAVHKPRNACLERGFFPEF